MSSPSAGTPRRPTDLPLCGHLVIESVTPAGVFRLAVLRSPAALMLAGVLGITGLRLLLLSFQPAAPYPGPAQYWVVGAAPRRHAGPGVFVYAFGARLYASRLGLWSALAYPSLPGASVSAFIISTDA